MVVMLDYHDRQSLEGDLQNVHPDRYEGTAQQTEGGMKPPQELDAIADVILAYRPKPKSKTAKKRKRRATKIAKAKANG
jgi:hypothetical protein